MLFNTTSRINYIKCSYNNRPKGYQYQNANPRNIYVLSYVEKGKAEFYSPSKKYIATDGEFMLISEKAVCSSSFHAPENWIFNIFFHLTEPFETEDIMRINKSADAAAVMDKLIKSYKRGIDDFYLLSYFYRLLYIFNQNIAADKKYEKIIPAVDYITQHFRENHPVKFYARLCAMSETAFRKLFHELTGQSPTAFRTSLRMKRAEELILDGQGITEAILEAGFNSPSYYYRKKREENQ